MIVTYASRYKNDLNHARSEASPRIPMARPTSGSPDMPTYQKGMPCMNFGMNCFGYITWQSTNSVDGI